MQTMEIIKTVAGILGAIGLPPLAGLIYWAVKQINKIRKENREREERQTKALQMILRSNLMQIYRDAIFRNCITDEDLQLFEDTYQIYHNMGRNGVMDSKRDKLLKLQIVEHY